MDEVSRPVIAFALILAAVFIPTAWVLLISIYFPNRQSSSTGSNRDRTTVKKKFADIALRSDIRLRAHRLSFFELLTASANLCKA